MQPLDALKELLRNVCQLDLTSSGMPDVKDKLATALARIRG